MTDRNLHLSSSQPLPQTHHTMRVQHVLTYRSKTVKSTNVFYWTIIDSKTQTHNFWEIEIILSPARLSFFRLRIHFLRKIKIWRSDLLFVFMHYWSCASAERDVKLTACLLNCMRVCACVCVHACVCVCVWRGGVFLLLICSSQKRGIVIQTGCTSPGWNWPQTLHRPLVCAVVVAFLPFQTVWSSKCQRIKSTCRPAYNAQGQGINKAFRNNKAGLSVSTGGGGSRGALWRRTLFIPRVSFLPPPMPESDSPARRPPYGPPLGA